MAIWIQQPDADGNCCDCDGRLEPCDSCGPVTGCACYLPWPSHLYVLGTGQGVYGCTVGAGWSPLFGGEGTINSFSVTPGTNSINGAMNMTGPTGSGPGLPVMFTSVSTEAATLTATCIGNLTRQDCVSLIMRVYDESYNLVGSDFDGQTPPCTNSFSFSTSVSVSAGCYFVQLYLPAVDTTHFGIDPACVLDATYSLGSSATMVFNPVRLVDTTPNTEICPKMLLPPLTESTDSWYANLAAAQAAIDDHTVNCDFFIGAFQPSDYDSLSISAPNDSFFVSETSSDNGPESTLIHYSFNLSANAIVTFAWSYNSAGNAAYRNPVGAMSLVVRDSSGAIVWSNGQNIVPDSDSGSFVSSTLPAGRYTVRVGTGAHYSTDIGISESTSLNGTFTPSVGAITGPNPIQALWDTGLDCPARLDCV